MQAFTLPRWFGGKAREPPGVHLQQQIRKRRRLPLSHGNVRLAGPTGPNPGHFHRRSLDPNCVGTEPQRLQGPLSRGPCAWGALWFPGSVAPMDSQGGARGPWLEAALPGDPVRGGAERSGGCAGSSALAPPSAGSWDELGLRLGCTGKRMGEGWERGAKVGGEVLQSQGPLSRPHRLELPGPLPALSHPPAGPGSRRATQRRGPTPRVGDHRGDPLPRCGEGFWPRLAQPMELGTLSTAHALRSRTSRGGDRAPGAARPHPPSWGWTARRPGGGARGEQAPGAERRCRAPAAPCPSRPRAGRRPRGCRPPADRCLRSVLSCPRCPNPGPPASPGVAEGEGGEAGAASLPRPRCCCRGCGYSPCSSASVLFHILAIIVRIPWPHLLRRFE